MKASEGHGTERNHERSRKVVEDRYATIASVSDLVYRSILATGALVQ